MEKLVSDASLEAISKINDEMQKRFNKLMDMQSGHEAVLLSILEDLPKEKDCRGKIQSRLRDLASAYDQHGPKGADNEFALMIRRFGGSYP